MLACVLPVIDSWSCVEMTSCMSVVWIVGGRGNHRSSTGVVSIRNKDILRAGVAPLRMYWSIGTRCTQLHLCPSHTLLGPAVLLDPPALLIVQGYRCLKKVKSRFGLKIYQTPYSVTYV